MQYCRLLTGSIAAIVQKHGFAQWEDRRTTIASVCASPKDRMGERRPTLMNTSFAAI